MSTQGQGDGGVYVSTQGPASYDLGDDEYEVNIIKDCFGVERIEEYKGKGWLDVIIIYGCSPSAFDQTPGGRDNAKMVSKTTFETFSLSGSDDNYFLRPDRILGAFQVFPGQSPRMTKASFKALKVEIEADRQSVEDLKENELQLQFNLSRIDKYITNRHQSKNLLENAATSMPHDLVKSDSSSKVSPRRSTSTLLIPLGTPLPSSPSLPEQKSKKKKPDNVSHIVDVEMAPWTSASIDTSASDITEVTQI